MVNSQIFGVEVVEFYQGQIKNEFESQRLADDIFETVDFVRISVPGDSLTIIDTFARDDHKNRFPAQWENYINKLEANIIGMPVEKWTDLTNKQVKTLKSLRFFTIESVSTASDYNLRSLQMISGMSVNSFRDKAKEFLKMENARNEHNSKLEIDSRISSLQNEKESTAKELEAIKLQMKILMDAMDGDKPKKVPKKVVEKDSAVKGKRGRPSKKPKIVKEVVPEIDETFISDYE